jgi:hypothetical protein
VSDNQLVISRSQRGHNPSIVTTSPLTRQNNHFRTHIRKLGNFIGIGLADISKFVLEGSKTLGQQQIGAINTAYFWQNTGINKIQMYGEGPKTVAPLAVGSIIDIQADFTKQRIYYWLNDQLQGYFQCTKFHMEEGKLYPCANLSVGTEIALRNEDFPLLDTRMAEDKDDDVDDDDLDRPTQPFPSET